MAHLWEWLLPWLGEGRGCIVCLLARWNNFYLDFCLFSEKICSTLVKSFSPSHIHLQVGPYSSHGHSSSSNMYTPIQPLNGLNGAKSTCGSNGQHSVASLQMVWDDHQMVWDDHQMVWDDQRMIGEVIKRGGSVLVLGWRDVQVAPRWLIVAWPQQQCCQWLKRIWNWFVRNQRWLWDLIRGALSTSWRWHFYYSPQRWNTKKYSTERSNMQIWINKYAMSTFSDHSNDDEGCENTDTQFNRYSLSFLCQKQQSTTYHFFELV